MQVHGHYSSQATSATRHPCPGCGRITAVTSGGYLWVHDRWNMQTGIRELCPGTYYCPADGTHAFTRGVA